MMKTLFILLLLLSSFNPVRVHADSKPEAIRLVNPFEIRDFLKTAATEIDSNQKPIPGGLASALFKNPKAQAELLTGGKNLDSVSLAIAIGTESPRHDADTVISEVISEDVIVDKN